MKHVFKLIAALFALFYLTQADAAFLGGSGPSLSGLAPNVTAQTFSISSPATTNQIVGTPVSSDSPTSWSLTSQSCANYFAVNATTGQISVTSTGSAALNGNASLVSCNVTVTATNATGTSAPELQTVNAYADGFQGAPNCTNVQFPSMLSGYATRAPWKVAAVDYYIGISPNATSSGNTITETGPSNTPANGDKKVVYSDCNNGLPSGLTTSTAYFVVNASTNTYQLSASSGGAAITLGAYSQGFIALKDPGNTATKPIGTSFSGGQVAISGNNVTLDHWDLGQENSWLLVPGNGISGLTVSNNNFLLGSNRNPAMWPEGNVQTNLTFINNVVDGNAIPITKITTGLASAQTVLPLADTSNLVVGMAVSDRTTANAISIGTPTGGNAVTHVTAINLNVSVTLSPATIGTVNSGDTITFQFSPLSDVDMVFDIVDAGNTISHYNWFKNDMGAMWQQVPATTSGTLTHSFNLWQNNAFGGPTIGAHGDVNQMFGSSGTQAGVVWSYNTVFMSNNLAGASLGLNIMSSGVSGAFLGSLLVDSNTWAIQASPANGGWGDIVNSTNTTWVNTSVTLTNNYMDPTGVVNGWYCNGTGCGSGNGGQNPTITKTGNLCMTTGRAPVANGIGSGSALCP